jgi:uncharacterized membrane protein YoaK (UPF0700 family)
MAWGGFAVPNPAETTLPVATLLSAAGGFLDAFTWVGHGGVFANAQTGNVVLLGVFAATSQWDQALRHIPPVAAFVLGVFIAHCLRLYGLRRNESRTALISLGVEIVLLSVVALLPSRAPDLPIVLGIALVAAVQSSSFGQVRSWAYNSVMTTGNLRRAVEALFAGLSTPGDRTALQQAGVFGTICATFALGAGVGAFFTVRMNNGALCVPVALLLLALWLCWPRMWSPDTRSGPFSGGG